MTTLIQTLRQQLIHRLWLYYCSYTPQMQLVQVKLKQIGINSLILDHFAIIDLPGPNSGIPVLSNLLQSLGFEVRGRDYLPSKQNDFNWLAEADCETKPVKDVLPQIVIADFRLDEMPVEIKKIIKKYAIFAKTPPKLDFSKKIEDYLNALIPFFVGRDWPLPTLEEFKTVQEYNELLAWVLIFGRRPNHFTLSIHLMEQYNSLQEFNDFIEQDVGLRLNENGGKIKGNNLVGIAQSSTKDGIERIELSDGIIELRTGFIEFAWRYSHIPGNQWSNYFTGFVGAQANKVIEALYV